jgi:toxin ParE1/3/4
MTKRIIFRPQASQDLDDPFAYIAEDDLEAACRFFDATRLTVAQIARMPGMGSLYPITNPRLQGIRKWAVKGFRAHLIFYCDHDDAVEIVRILSATRDISSILESAV